MATCARGGSGVSPSHGDELHREEDDGTHDAGRAQVLLALVLAHLASGLDAVDVGHLDVAPHEVGPELLEALDGLRAAARLGERHLLRLEERDEDAARDRVVVDDEDPGGRGSLLSGRRVGGLVAGQARHERLLGALGERARALLVLEALGRLGDRRAVLGLGRRRRRAALRVEQRRELLAQVARDGLGEVLGRDGRRDALERDDDGRGRADAGRRLVAERAAHALDDALGDCEQRSTESGGSARDERDGEGTHC